MKKIVYVGTLLGCLLLFSACSSEPKKDVSDKSSSTTEKSSKKYVQPSKIEKKRTTGTSADSSDGGLTLSRKVTWSDDWHGLKTNISEVLLGKPTNEEKEKFNWTGNAAMGIKFVIDNASNEDMSVNMSSDVIAVIDNQQIQPKAMVPTQLAGDELSGSILSGVKKEGLLLFDIPNLDTDLNDLSEVRLKWSVNNPSAEAESDKSKEYDVVLNLN